MLIFEILRVLLTCTQNIQFAGGFDAETIHAFQELKKIGMGSVK